MIEYIININIYLIFFGLFYNVFLRGITNFKLLRYYIILSFILSFFFPLFHNKMFFLFAENKISTLVINYNFINLTTKPIFSVENLFSATNKDLTTHLLTVLSILIFFISYIYKHLGIRKLIFKSEKTKYKKTIIARNENFIVPALYHKYILMPKFNYESENESIIRHEYAHYQYKHYIDNYLFQITHCFFWFNPIFYLLRREMSLIHEYQVDNKLINSNIDVLSYKLTLIKYSVGSQKFAIANSLSNCKIKKRLIMMNNVITNKGKWKILFIIPLLSILLINLSFITEKNSFLETNTNIYLSDTIDIKIQTISESDFLQYPEKNWIISLMNKKSQYYIDQNLCQLNEIDKIIVKSYEKRINTIGSISESFSKDPKTIIKLVVRKDIKANTDNYKKLLDQISTGIYQLYEIYSLKMYEKSFKNLNQNEKNKITNFIEPIIYSLPDRTD